MGPPYTQRIINSASLRLVSPKVLLQGSPWAGIWEVRLWEAFLAPYFLFSDKSGSCLTVQTTQYMLTTCFPLESLEFWCMPGRWHLHAQPYIKNPGQECLMGFPGRQHFTLLSNTVTVRIQCLLCVTLLGEAPRQLVPLDFGSHASCRSCLASFCCNKAEP